MLRVIATKALLGNTFCEDRVLDSPLDPVDVIEKGATITIYTGESHAKPTDKSLMDVEWKIDFSIHMHLPASVQVAIGNVNTRNGGGEMLFDVLWRQILKSLYLLDNKWAQLWREAIISIDSLQARPFMVELDKGVRIPAREVIFAAQTLIEPPFGPVDPASWWGRVIALLDVDTDPDMVSLGQLLRAETEGVSNVSAAASLRAYLGLSDEEYAGIGLASLSPPLTPLVHINVATVGDGSVNIVS